jgi:hypothetical protein
MLGPVRAGVSLEPGASLNLVPPSARPTQSTLIVTMPNGLRWGMLWHFGVKQSLPKIVQVAHAATFFVSPFEEATILVMDGYGDELNRPIPAREIALSASPRTTSSIPSACSTLPSPSISGSNISKKGR